MGRRTRRRRTPGGLAVLKGLLLQLGLGKRELLAPQGGQVPRNPPHEIADRDVGDIGRDVAPAAHRGRCRGGGGPICSGGTGGLVEPPEVRGRVPAGHGPRGRGAGRVHRRRRASMTVGGVTGRRIPGGTRIPPLLRVFAASAAAAVGSLMGLGQRLPLEHVLARGDEAAAFGVLGYQLKGLRARLAGRPRHWLVSAALALILFSLPSSGRVLSGGSSDSRRGAPWFDGAHGRECSASIGRYSDVVGV